MTAMKSLVLLSPPAAHAAPRRRGWPSDRWELDAADDCDIAACATFLDALESWPRQAWLDLGRRAATVADEDGPDALDAVITVRALGVTAWLVRDLIATAAATACGARPTRELVAARRVVERAALAHLLRPWLRLADYRALTALPRGR
jgi:hypothetical protein